MNKKIPYILILDDDPNLLGTLRDILMLKGFEPVLARTGRAALAEIHEKNIDVALIDLRLDDMSGLEALRDIKAYSPDTECIMLTGHASQGSAIEAINLGAYSYFQKPFDMESVLVSIGHAVERRVGRLALAESEARYHTFINAATDMAFLKDEQFRYLMVNEANTSFFGKPVAEIIGKADFELMEAQAAEGCRLSDQQVLENNTSHIEIEYVAGRIYETRKFPVPLSNGHIGVGGYVRDITERKLAEEEIVQLNAKLEQRVAERTTQLENSNKELEAFAYSISHDLRAPLRGIDGWSQALLEDYSDRLDEKGRLYLDRVRSETQRMGQLIDDILELSRVTRTEMQIAPVDLSNLAKNVIARLQISQPDRQVEFFVQPGLVAPGDGTLLSIVLTNLLDNAWKFTSKIPQARIEFGQTAVDGQNPFFVRDNGIGFDMAFAYKLFGVFHRLHKADEYPGTGVGLATVQRIILRHGGRIWVDAQINQGATFFFTLGEAD